MIFNIKHTANWEYIRARKQALIKKNNKAENSKRIAHDYKVGDRVMLRKGTENKQEQPYSGPHVTTKIHTNGTVRLRMGAIIDMVNLSLIHI